MQQKRKILFLTNHCGLYTGFGRHIRSLLTYIYKNFSDKYEPILAAGGQYHHNPDFQRFPWQIYGVMPIDAQAQERMKVDMAFGQECAYGKHTIEKIVMDCKPDVIVGIEDEWGCGFLKHFEFAKHIPIVYHVTLDSLPILREAFDTASKTKYYWTWANFAAKRMRGTKGLEHVSCQYSCMDTKKFFPLDKNQKQKLRAQFNIPQDAKIFGFVFRNQPRKLVNKLLEGYALFKKRNPKTKTFLLTHTSYHEGAASWNIPELVRQYGVNPNEVLCTYVCRATKKYYVAPFQGEELDNTIENHPKSMFTTDIVHGVSEEQLNEIYALMDLYIHPMNSGGQEIPICEAALAGLPVACPNYSCGEDVIELNKGSFDIKFDLYTEPTTHFHKANCRPDSIAAIMEDFCILSSKDVAEKGRLSRDWAVTNYSTDKNALEILKKIDEIPQHTWDFKPSKEKPKNPDHPFQEIKDDVEFILDLYKNVLNSYDETATSKGCMDWQNSLKNGVTRRQVYDFFIDVAKKENQKNNVAPQTFVDLIDKTDKKNLLVVIPESGGDILSTLGLLPAINRSYPETNIYFACNPQFAGLALGNSYIHKVIPFDQSMENEMLMIGAGGHKGYFDYYIRPGVSCQKFLNYLGNPNIGLQV